MTYEIYINDSLIEISTPKTIGLTFQVASIFDPESRSGNLTNSFIAPFTLVNNIVLGNLLNINSDSNLPYQRNTAKIVQNGIEIVPNGFALIDEASNGYKIAIYSGNVSFFDLIKDLNVSDLDWTDLNHVYATTAIKNSFNNVDKYIYPIIEWGKNINLLNTSNSIDAISLIPCLFLKTIFDRVFTYINYTVKGTFILTSEYPRLITNINKWGFSQSEVESFRGYADTITPVSSSFTVTAGSGTISQNISITYTNFTIADFTTINYTPSDWVFGDLSFYYHYEFIRPATGVLVTLVGKIYKDGVLVASNTFSTSGFPSGAVQFVGTKNIIFSNIFFDPSSVYSVELTLNGQRTGSDYNISYQLFASNFTIDPKGSIPIGATIPFTSLLNTNVGNIFKDISNMYNLITQTNEVTREVFISPLNDLTRNIPNAINWSDKIDLSKKITVKYNIGSYAQTNILKYADDEDVFIDTGKGSINVLNENLPKESTLIELSAVASDSVVRTNNLETPNVKFQEIQGGSFDKKKQRYFLLEKQNIPIILNGVTCSTNIPYCYFSKTGKADSLDFTSLIAANYGTLQGMLNKIKFVSAYFQLKETDVVNIDFTIPVYLDISDGRTVVNGYFYINKISNFKVDSSTLVELIRL